MGRRGLPLQCSVAVTSPPSPHHPQCPSPPGRRCVCVCVCVCVWRGGREEQRVKQMECTFQRLVNIIRGKPRVRHLRPAQALLFPELSSNVSLTILNCIYTFRELMWQWVLNTSTYICSCCGFSIIRWRADSQWCWAHLLQTGNGQVPVWYYYCRFLLHRLLWRGETAHTRLTDIPASNWVTRQENKCQTWFEKFIM